MIPSSGPPRNAEHGKIERDYRIVGWWGMALATFGLLVLLASMTSLLLD